MQRTNEGKEAVLILIKQIVPCIMHTKNRVGQKIITVVISIGAISGLDWYVEHIQNIVQKQILGSEVAQVMAVPTEGEWDRAYKSIIE